ncbi:unnamed protein product [Bursaphelenchus xylophilus]|uniref:(pine wood nematode) hypothetical protein n=1 Tax=Bursaphelenchus xylophilus TaxID=6326 RepID=A0A1I7RTV2_BURXY|nr:unnamed protein product [Bursaphelenchus xylophilus]CAG9122086.1 unnamed protein product [Bursaphelenchus xylophilus]
MANTSIFSKSHGEDSSVRETNFVACFSHSNVADADHVKLEEHVNRQGCKIFTMVDPSDNPVKIVGTEEGEDQNYEYVLAFHNRATKEVEVRPVSVLHFQPKQNVTEEFLKGKKKRVKVDLNRDRNTVDKSNWREKANDLVMEFGNAKRRKILEASLRRKVNDDTLESLGTSMLDVSKADMSLVRDDGDGKSTLNLSMLSTPESMVLPTMNRDAKKPAEVYSLDQFVKPDDFLTLGPSAAEYLGENDTLEKLLDNGISQFVAQSVLTNIRADKKVFITAMKIITWSRMYRKLAEKGNRGRLNTEGIVLPPPYITDFVADFTEGQVGRQAGVYKVSPILKHKLAAHLICLLLLFSEEYVLPLGPLRTEIGISEVESKKMCESLGCLISPATVEEMTKYRTTKMARLIGPGANGQANGLRKRRGR